MGVTAIVGLWFPELLAEKPGFFDAPLTGTAKEIAAAIHGYSELGVQHLMIQIAPYTPAALERLTEALHLFRSAASTN